MTGLEIMKEIADISNTFKSCHLEAIKWDNEYIDKLYDLVSSLKLEYFKFNYKDVVEEIACCFEFNNLPPVTYCDVYTTSFSSITIFIVHGKSKIPLHNHPNMYGYLKVLDGGISLKSYSIVEKNFDKYIEGLMNKQLNNNDTENVSEINLELDNYRLNKTYDKYPSTILKSRNDGLEKHRPFNVPITVIKNIDLKVVTNKNKPIFFTPYHSNIHSISVSPENDYAIFIDVLMPPYDMVIRDCTYYNLHHITWITPQPSLKEESSNQDSNSSISDDSDMEYLDTLAYHEILKRKVNLTPRPPPEYFWTNTLQNEKILQVKQEIIKHHGENIM
ncbi:2-aminoethanethiol dioxygenase [Intoshia linei]|uniref:2-aminoethanethiol dioxygenase n=1 Tax=Intoshia linei TaxID=1819745 RepID=A0A177AXU8_9BILA|nr:2-aminoethanethiol dioxygenase [Intoshia linei]